MKSSTSTEREPQVLCDALGMRVATDCLRHGALFCGPCEVENAPRCRHGGLWKMCSLCYPPESGAEDSHTAARERLREEK